MFLRNLFGKFWLLYSSFLLILTFAPLFIFWNRVTLDPVKFTEEWIKLFSSGLIIGFIILYFNDNYNKRSEIFLAQKLYEINFKIPLESILVKLESNQTNFDVKQEFYTIKNYLIKMDSLDKFAGNTFCEKLILKMESNDKISEVDLLTFKNNFYDLKENYGSNR